MQIKRTTKQNQVYLLKKITMVSQSLEKEVAVSLNSKSISNLIGYVKNRGTEGCRRGNTYMPL